MIVRDGFYASWRGLEYEAGPDGEEIRLYTGAPAEGFTEVGPGRHVRVVAADEVERLSYITTMCEWQGEPFQVLGEHETWLRVEYAGTDPAVAARLGLELFDRGVHQAWAPRSDVRELREERI
ncbi:hypothetical protein [Thermomonospora umbrina]|uniref:Uncharacterized protein n=1 Tax=Thermomonospora umbrina TaxID=111806 RepID=A0A3D9SRC4_9ACTN|nr:hypothetical protein [Thermomonospora umbrina]REE95495.1 hypothetical protein DFJ69_0885 [Thermomonospora umbrina]